MFFLISVTETDGQGSVLVLVPNLTFEPAGTFRQKITKNNK